MPDISVAMTAVMIHLCPFTHDGKQYSVIPLNELNAIAAQVEKERPKEAAAWWNPSDMGVIVTTEGCSADDGKTMPVVNPRPTP